MNRPIFGEFKYKVRNMSEKESADLGVSSTNGSKYSIKWLGV